MIEKLRLKLPFSAAIFSIFIVWMAGVGSFRQAEPIARDRLAIQLRLIPAFQNQPREQLQTGLLWSLSLLGARLPEGCREKLLRPIEADIFTLDLAEAGFPEAAHRPLALLLDSLKRTEEYARCCGIDIGRFVVLTVHSPHHYYRISGAERQLDDFLKKHALHADNQEVIAFPVVNSNVADGLRVLRFVDEPEGRDLAFVAEEGRGRLEFGNFQPTDFEVFTVMPNGQLRFAVYDREGALQAASSPVLGAAGKPGKCMWCHESALQNLFQNTPRTPGALPTADFRQVLAAMQFRLERFQNSLRSEINFSDKKAHETHELLYASFMEPSAERLAAEWQLPLDAVKNRLRRCSTHRNPEYPDLGEGLYDRSEVDALAPFQTAPVPESVRETSRFEPDFLSAIFFEK